MGIEYGANMPLTKIKKGGRVRLISIEGGTNIQGKLSAMGLIPGTEIEVLSDSIHGPFLISIMGSRISIGRNMAQKIIVV
jgi:ferrous iron transport protein A